MEDKSGITGMKDTKIKLTPQRSAILEYFEGNTSHPSAEDIYKAVKERYPMVSFATVYNTLSRLKELGEVWELTIDDERKRYDPNTATHHHLLCLKCRKIVDIHHDFDLSFPDEQTQGFKVTGCHVEFYGLCQECVAGEV